MDTNDKVPLINHNGNREFYSQLEGLRGLAVLLVMISHFVIVPQFPQLHFLKFGFWGVNLFFVLSGFLITEILLRDIGNDFSPKQILKKFFIRRTLRIFPIYYLSIILLYIFDVSNSREVAGYTLTYTFNLANFYTGISSEVVQHFWSLCVEEQFYLLWPLLLVFINKRFHFMLIVSMIAIGVFSRVIYIGLHMPNHVNYIWATPACFDCLGLGALLAWMKLNRMITLQKILKLYFIPVLLAAICFGIAVKAGGNIDSSETFNIAGRLLTGLTGFFLIGLGALSKPTYYGKLMNNKWLKKFGKISYGLYVYHWILYVLFNAILTKWLQDILSDYSALSILRYNVYILTFIVLTAMSVMLAYISFKIIELPVQRLRTRFEKT